MDVFPSDNPQEMRIKKNGELFALKICTVKICIIYINFIRCYILEK